MLTDFTPTPAVAHLAIILCPPMMVRLVWRSNECDAVWRAECVLPRDVHRQDQRFGIVPVFKCATHNPTSKTLCDRGYITLETTDGPTRWHITCLAGGAFSGSSGCKSVACQMPCHTMSCECELHHKEKTMHECPGRPPCGLISWWSRVVRCVLYGAGWICFGYGG